MKRAQFKDFKSQRKFFLDVKRKLNLGGKKLSERLGLKSRGAIENYSAGRTSPSLEIIRKLEQLSGINAEYSISAGKIYRKKREFMPADPLMSESILRKRFKGNFKKIDEMVRSDLSIKEICNKIRKMGNHFDTHRIGIFIGAYRKNILCKISKEIKMSKEDISINGFIRPENKTQSICFNLVNLYNRLSNHKVRVGLEISEDRKNIRIFPLYFGRTLSKSSGCIKIQLTEKSGLKIGENVRILLNPEDFGFSMIESIYDSDARLLAKKVISEGFRLDSYRSTPSNHKGDLSLFLGGKNIIIEITRAESYRSSQVKIGQLFIQNISWPKSKQVFICREGLLMRSIVLALKKLKVKIITTEFEKGWEEKIAKKLKNV